MQSVLQPIWLSMQWIERLQLQKFLVTETFPLHTCLESWAKWQRLELFNPIMEEGKRDTRWNATFTPFLFLKFLIFSKDGLRRAVFLTLVIDVVSVRHNIIGKPSKSGCSSPLRTRPLGMSVRETGIVSLKEYRNDNSKFFYVQHDQFGNLTYSVMMNTEK